MTDPVYLYAERMDLQLRHLAVLVAVVDAGTFTDAAARLGVSQAAVSRSVAALEAALGVRLLDRTTRQVTPTEDGLRVAAQAQHVLDEVAHLRRLVEPPPTELRIGYAWAALGRHTRALQKRWAREHMQTPLVFVQVNEAAAGLADGSADVSVIRRPVRDARFATAEIGLESRYAAVSTGTALARRRPLRLADLIRYTVAIDARTGTTTLDLWPPDAQPTSVRTTHGVDEWLTLIAAGQAVGVTSEATANQNPRPGVAYRQLVDAPPIRVQLAWWRDNPPRQLGDLLTLARQTYA
jgi:DNA-binding transcriptional LysR family regulator